jgi:rhodanese-related sulfurtransferase
MRTIGVTIRQATILLVVGLAVGLAVNAARGKNRINLSRDYYAQDPDVEPGGPQYADAAGACRTIQNDYRGGGCGDRRGRVARAGLDLIVDARNDDLYGRGHIPNAVQCDAYNLEDHINEVLSMALGAERVIVYCHGGNCEDSYLLCQELVMRGVQKEALYVFKAGWDGWQAYQRGETDGTRRTRRQVSRIKAIELSQVLELFEDPRATDGTYVFVDARADDPYQAGHIPGAIQCDYYRIDYYFPEVMQKASAAEKIIVYCNGGDCEDSLYVCGELLKADIPRAHILLFKGGWEAWTQAGHPFVRARSKRHGSAGRPDATTRRDRRAATTGAAGRRRYVPVPVDHEAAGSHQLP